MPEPKPPLWPTENDWRTELRTLVGSIVHATPEELASLSKEQRDRIKYLILKYLSSEEARTGSFEVVVSNYKRILEMVEKLEGDENSEPSWMRPWTPPLEPLDARETGPGERSEFFAPPGEINLEEDGRWREERGRETRPKFGIPRGQVEAMRDVRERILKLFPNEEPRILPKIRPQSLSEWNAGFRHPVRKFLFLKKMPKGLGPEEQFSYLQAEIAQLREENERMRKESSEISDGFLHAVKRIPGRFFSSVKRDWNGAKIVELSKKLERVRTKLDRKNRH